MASVTTNDGREWLSEKAVGQHGTEELYEVAVGNGTTSPTVQDTSMESQLYSATDADSNVSVTATSDIAIVQCRITISGGAEVPAGSDISEFDLLTDSGVFVYHETRSAVTLESGDTKTFEFELTIED